MTVWKLVENEDCYAVAIYPYSPAQQAEGQPPHLPLSLGELVQVTRRSAAWCWGRSAASGGEGAFPAAHVVYRECTVEREAGCVRAVSAGGEVEHDTALALRAWLPLWKQLYISCDARFKFMEVSMRALLELRRELRSAPPRARARRLAATAATAVDKGNRTLELELQVRGAGGRRVDPLALSLHALHDLHEQTNARLDRNMETTPRSSEAPSEAAADLLLRRFSLLVRVQQLVAKTEGGCWLQLALYDGGGARLSDALLAPVAPLAAGAAAQVLFTDLSVELKRERIFLGCVVVRIGAMEPQTTDPRRISAGVFGGGGVCAAPALGGVGGGGGGAGGGVRRPVGVAAADITHYVAQHYQGDIPLPYYPYEKEYLELQLRKVITSKEPKDSKHTQALWVTVQPLEGGWHQVREAAESGAVARGMRLPAALTPSDVRHELYVTLVSGHYSRGNNLQLCASLVNAQGEKYPKAIFLGAGVPLTDEYTSVVYYHDDKPKWNETFKICVDIEEFKEAALVVAARHRSSNEAKDRAERPHALSYLRLVHAPRGTTLPDSAHCLLVYRIDYKKCVSSAPEAEAAAACLLLPPSRAAPPSPAAARSPLSLCPKDHLLVETLLCSTRLTQREEILGVLQWSTLRGGGELRAALRRLLRVPSDELVKFMSDILDALFTILTQVEEDEDPTLMGYTEDSIAVLVLDCLLRVVSLVADHKYQHFCTVLQHYIDHSFCDAMAYQKLLSVVTWVVEGAGAGAGGGEAALKRLLQSMKCLQWLCLLAARSRALRAALAAPPSPAPAPAPDYYFTRFLGSLETLMRLGDAALTSQGAALKFLPPAVAAIATVYPLPELARAVVDALAALPLARLGKQRVSSLAALWEGPLGAPPTPASSPAPRDLLLTHLAQTVAALLDMHSERSRGGGDRVTKAARLLGADTSALHHYRHHHHMVELCVSTLGAVCARLLAEHGGGGEAAREHLLRLVLPALLAAALDAQDAAPDPAQDALLRRVQCCVLDVVRGVRADTFRAACGVPLCAALVRLQPAATRAPRCLQLHRAALHATLHALTLVAGVLEASLRATRSPDEEVRALAAAWSARLADVACDKSLAPSARLDARYTALPPEAARLAARMWDAAGSHSEWVYLSWCPDVLQMSLLADAAVRAALIPVLYSMLDQADRLGMTMKLGEAALDALEALLLERLDALVEAGAGDHSYTEALDHADPAEAVSARARGVARTACRALAALVLLREHAACPLLTRHFTTQLLHFHKDRPHMYLKYVDKLFALHRAAGDWTEAALTLQLRAAACADRQHKEEIYMEMVDLLQRGQQWEMCVDVLRDLVQTYEREAGYQALAGLHARLAELYAAAHSEPRSLHAHYRVTLYGGARRHLPSPHGYVYRGEPLEQLAEFRARMLDVFPGARLLDSLDEPPAHLQAGPDLYLQVVSVEGAAPAQALPEHVARYYRHNHVATFHYSRPLLLPPEEDEGSAETEIAAGEGEEEEGAGEEDELTRMWIERTELDTEYPLPGIVKWAAVQCVRRVLVSPPAQAVESARASLLELRRVAGAVSAGREPLHALSMRLAGTLDAAVQGGLQRLERAFLAPTYRRRHPQHAAALRDLERAIADHAPALAQGVSLHGSRAPRELEALHLHLSARLAAFLQHVRAAYPHLASDVEPAPPAPAPDQDVLLRRLLPAASEPRTETDRHSDNSHESTSRLKFFSFNSAQLNPLSRYSSGFATIQSTPKRRDKRRARKSEASSGSQWYMSANGGSPAPPGAGSPAPAGGDLAPLPAAPPIAPPLRELSQQLVSARPPRERRLSQRTSLLSHSNRDSLGTTDSNQEEEEPPPLPAKSRPPPRADDNNNPPPAPAPAPVTTRYSYDTVLAPQGSFLYRDQRAQRDH